MNKNVKILDFKKQYGKIYLKDDYMILSGVVNTSFAVCVCIYE